MTYFHGLLPVFQHPIDDSKTFYMITGRFYVNGHATQAGIFRAFGVTSISLKRAVKCYREKDPAGFYEGPARCGPAVLTLIGHHDFKRLHPVRSEWLFLPHRLASVPWLFSFGTPHKNSPKNP